MTYNLQKENKDVVIAGWRIDNYEVNLLKALSSPGNGVSEMLLEKLSSWFLKDVYLHRSFMEVGEVNLCCLAIEIMARGESDENADPANNCYPRNTNLVLK